MKLIDKITSFFKIEKSLEEECYGMKCEKCGNNEYIVKDCGFTAICTKCGKVYYD